MGRVDSGEAQLNCPTGYLRLGWYIERSESFEPMKIRWQSNAKIFGHDGVGPNVGPSLMTSRCGGEDKSGSFRSADCQLTKPGVPIRKLRLGLQLIWFISCPFICFKNSFVKKYEYWIEIVRLVFLWLPWMQFSRLIWHNLTIPTSPFTQVILWCSFVLWQNESGKVWKPVEW